MVREIPSAHVLQISTPHFDKPIPCLMKAIHREKFDKENGLSMTIIIGLEPSVRFDSEESSSDQGYSAHEGNSASEGNSTDAGSALNENLKSMDGEANTSKDGANEGLAVPDIDFDAPDEEFLENLLHFAKLDDLGL